MSFELIVKERQAKPRSLKFALDEAVQIGRAPQCRVRSEDPAVSRVHLTLTVDGDQLRVVDSSTNGSLIGDRILVGSEARVPLDTPLQVGPLNLQVKRGKPAAQATEPALTQPRETAIEPARDEPRAAAQHDTAELRRDAHRLLLQRLDLVNSDPTKLSQDSLRPRVLQALRGIVSELRQRLPDGADADRLVGEVADEALGLGPLEQLLADPSVSEIMVIDPETIYVERNGKSERTGLRFTDDARVRAAIERIVTPLGRRIDESSPLVDARLRDGSRVNAVIRPLALRGTCITIRKFPKQALTLARLLEIESLSEAMAEFLVRAVKARKNIVVAGGTGSGKTTLLNVLSAAIGEGERIVTIEDAAELSLHQPHVVPLEARPANLEGQGEYTIRDLVKNALRMRPDRIVVGECRGGEALDMLQAMNTGHEGSLTTLHANSPREAVMRLETLCLMAGIDLPLRAIREQIARTLHLVVQQKRLQDGARKIVEIAEVIGLDRQGDIRLAPLYRFCPHEVSAAGKVQGSFVATGFLPTFMGEFRTRGLHAPGERVA